MENNVEFGSGLIDGKWSFDGRLSKISSDGYVDRAFSNLKSFYFSGGYYGKTTMLKFVTFSGKERTYQSWYGIPKDSLKTIELIIHIPTKMKRIITCRIITSCILHNN